MPIMFVLFLFSFPAGLFVYWVTTNVWTIGQQLVIQRTMPKPEELAAKAKSQAQEAQPTHGDAHGLAVRGHEAARGEDGQEGWRRLRRGQAGQRRARLQEAAARQGQAQAGPAAGRQAGQGRQGAAAAQPAGGQSGKGKPAGQAAGSSPAAPAGDEGANTSADGPAADD